ncbi:branched-chain amino acid ABC transporter permease [Butyrivibrio sp. XPD2002]|uniref:branched-chain amino acid ABC transporter permease n=1 Tax=Butyrivibrio sp. XPD2002 TaxID=1280665 RepID=UPI000411DA7C|nr:branched-chain amino acid ABC transporter permease [Butyrivibrio sp. XPD2002]
MKQKKINLRALAAIAVMLLIIILLENISSIIPGLPQVFWPTSPLFTVLKKAAVYSLVAVSMNLLNGFTGLFSLGQAGFMLLGAYTYAILMVPAASKEQVYYLFGGCAFNSSIIDILGGIFGTTGVGGAISMIIGCIIAIILAGCVAGFFAYLIGFPVLRLKSDYLAIATLGFAEILRAIFQWQKLGKITNGANMIKGFPTFSSFNITDGAGHEIVRLSTFVPFLISTVCIVIIVLLINSSYGRAFKSIRDDEVAAEAMGINLFSHKMLSFVISSFFAGVGGALFAMYVANAQAKAFTSVMTYEILLIVVIGGIGSVSGSVLATFLYVACSEWWLRFLDSELYIGSFKVPFLRNGFRMVVFSIVIMVIVLFFSQGIMGEKEISLAALFDRSSRKKERKE